MFKSKNKSGKKKRINLTLDTGIMKEAKKVLKKKYNEVNLSELVDWRLEKFIDDELTIEKSEVEMKK